MSQAQDAVNDELEEAVGELNAVLVLLENRNGESVMRESGDAVG